jgi:SAM-dependent methyltransferase
MVSRGKAYARVTRNRYAVFGKGMIGRILYGLFTNSDTRAYLRNRVNASFPSGDLIGLGIASSHKLLDVGCGSGSRLLDLYEAGFRKLIGIDPYIMSDIHYRNGVKVLKRTIHDIDGSWDVIMFHHSFEHISDQVETLQSVGRLLSSNGLCVIRIPIVTSYAWDNYKEHWVQLDAPRHFYLHSVKSMQLLAAKAELWIEKIVYDSTGFQFWGSEQYSRDIPLFADHSYAVDRERSVFSKTEIERFEEKALLLNAESRGDQAAFYLRK